MYIFTKAVALERAAGSQWQEIDLSAVRLIDIFNRYAECYWILTNSFSPEELTVDIQDLRKDNLSNTDTVTVFLAQLGTKALPHSSVRIELKRSEVRYSDAFRARYNVRVMSPYVGNGVQVPREEADWLSLTRQGTPMRDVGKYCMASVNGFFHMTDSDDEAFYVVDGGRTMRHSNRNELGLYNYEGIGSIQCVPIKDDMVHQRWPAQPLSKQCYIEPDIDLSKKTVMLVFMGYLHALDSATFYRVNDNTYCLDLENYPLLERYYEASKTLDLTSLQLNTTGANGKKVELAHFLSAETIRAMMALSQSFLVAVDNPYMYVKREAIRRTTTPGNYITYTKPTLPMMLGTGRMAEYWTQVEDGQWAVTVNCGFRDNLLVHTTNSESSRVAPGDNRIAFNPMELSRAFFLKIGSEINIKG